MNDQVSLATLGGLDPQSEQSLTTLSHREQVQKNRVSGVRTVLVILSSAAMIYDVESLRQMILSSYGEAAIFFKTTSGKSWGVPAPQSVDLLIDLTGPRERQGLFYARRLRRMSGTAVGRDAGLFRRRIYDRIFDEKAKEHKGFQGIFERERVAQRGVLELAGVAVVPASSATEDLSKRIALNLPPLRRG